MVSCWRRLNNNSSKKKKQKSFNCTAHRTSGDGFGIQINSGNEFEVKEKNVQSIHSEAIGNLSSYTLIPCAAIHCTPAVTYFIVF